jgi:hypothetical protein
MLAPEQPTYIPERSQFLLFHQPKPQPRSTAFRRSIKRLTVSAARVLVVDDEQICLEVTSRSLSHVGYSVFQASGPPSP